MGCGSTTLNRSDEAENDRSSIVTASSPSNSTEDRAKDDCDAIAKADLRSDIWTGVSGKRSFSWNTVDLSISNGPGGSMQSFWRSRVVEDFSNLKRDSRGLRCLYDRELTLLSVVGDLISVSDLASIYCGTNSSFANFLTFDISKVENMPTLNSNVAVEHVSLKQLFPSEQLFSGLARSREVNELIKLERSNRRPRNLAELLQLISEKYNRHRAGDYALSVEMENFAFVELRRNKVRVRLFVMPTSGYNANTSKYIDIELPKPKNIATQLERASVTKEGFLLRDQQRMFGQAMSKFQCSFDNQE